MRYFCFFFLLLLSTAACSETYNYKVLRVIDGDTIEIEANFLPDPLAKKLSLRILGVDTPEKKPRAHCTRENLLSLKAKFFTEEKISHAESVTVEIVKWDKYGGRVLGDVIVDGRRLSELLVDSNFAIPYKGDKKVYDWCDHKH